MKETHYYYRSTFDSLKKKGWTVIPFNDPPNQAPILDWCRANGTGKFFYCSEPNKDNWSFVIELASDAQLLVNQFNL